jgi:hypothetical protein
VPLAVRAGQYKLILDEAGGTPSLFDLAHDPLETEDLMTRRPDVGQALLSELYRWNSERFRSDPTFGYRFMRKIPVPDRR